jgi:tRNA pseudouridine32 synthase/23S rRNA pseudouridine746 synthase
MVSEIALLRLFVFNERMRVFENENFIAVDKPPMVLTTPSRDARDPRPCLGKDLQARMGSQIFPVHRLDFEVGGLVLFAKTREAHRQAQVWFEQAQVGKTYLALSEPVSGATASDWLEWRSCLVRGKRRAFEAQHGKDSLTRARLLDPSRALWELMPITGRPHQLRFEMFKHGHPILRDTLYGAKPDPSRDASDGIALRAVKLDFSGLKERLGLPERIEISALNAP